MLHQHTQGNITGIGYPGGLLWEIFEQRSVGIQLTIRCKAGHCRRDIKFTHTGYFKQCVGLRWLLGLPVMQARRITLRQCIYTSVYVNNHARNPTVDGTVELGLNIFALWRQINEKRFNWREQGYAGYHNNQCQ